VATALAGDLIPDGGHRDQAGVGHHRPARPEEDGAADDRGQPPDEGLLRVALAHRPEEGVLQRHRPLERGEVVAQVGPVDESDDVPERDLERHFEDREVPGPGFLQQGPGGRPEHQPHAEAEGGDAAGLRLGHQLALQLGIPPEPDAGGEHDVVPGRQLLGPVGLDGLSARHRPDESRR
jgi:hypothetical protein